MLRSLIPRLKRASDDFVAWVKLMTTW